MSSIYELTKVRYTDYNSHGDASIIELDNGFVATNHAGGHSDKERFAPGTVVLCKLCEKNGETKIQGLAKVLSFENGMPASFGSKVDHAPYEWSVPKTGDKVSITLTEDLQLNEN